MKTPTTPLVSILIPTYRRPALLKKAIASALNQDCQIEYEIIVVDNEQDKAIAAEVDNTVANYCSEKLFLHRNEYNLGAYGNWNRCVELAKGKWVTILNDDDILLPDFLTTVTPYIKEANSIIATRKLCLDQRQQLKRDQRIHVGVRGWHWQ